MSHTPGPWAIRGDDNLVYADDERGTIICNFPYSLKAGNNMDDARLIAAAPELYDAAENALDTLLSCCVAGDGVDDRDAILEAQQMLRAAIRKAMGEE